MKNANDYARHAVSFAARAGVSVKMPPRAPGLRYAGATHNAMLLARRAARLARIIRREKTRDDAAVGALHAAAIYATQWCEGNEND